MSRQGLVSCLLLDVGKVTLAQHADIADIGDLSTDVIPKALRSAWPGTSPCIIFLHFP